MANPKIEVEIGAKVSALTNALKDAEGRLQSFGRRASQLGTVFSAALTLPLTALGAASIKTFGDIEALKKGLIAVTGSATKAEAEFKKLIEVAKLPGLGLEEAVRGSVSLQSAGFSADEARKSLLAFGNALATVGKGKNELNFVILALTQLQNKTTGFGQDLRQLTEQLPQLRGALTNAFGTSDSEAIAKLGVTGREVVDLLVTEFEKLPKVTGGIKNAFENLGDSTKISFARIGESINKAFNVEGLINKVADVIDRISTGFSNLDSGTQKLIIVMAGLAAAIGPLLLAIGGIIQALPLITAGFVALTGPIGLISLAVAAAIPLLINLNSELKKTAKIAGLVKADLLAKSLQESEEAFKSLAKTLQSKLGLSQKQAELRAIDLLLKQEQDLLKSRLTGSRVDADASRARTAALLKIKSGLLEVKTGVDAVNTSFEDFSKGFDAINSKLTQQESFIALETENAEKLKKVGEELIDVYDRLGAAIIKGGQLGGFKELDVPLPSGAPQDDKADDSVALLQNFNDSIKNGLISSNDIFSTFVDNIRKFKELSELISSDARLEEKLAAIGTQAQLISGAFNTLGQSISRAFGNGNSKLGEFLGSFISFAGKMIAEYYAMSVAASVAGASASAAATGPAAIFTLPGFIAGALGLVAAAFSGIGGGSKRGGGSVGSSVSGQTFSGSGISDFNPNRELFGELVVRGNDLVYVLGETRTKIAKG